MHPIPPIFPPSEPVGIAKWLLVAFAVGMLVFESVSAFRMWKVAGSDALLSLAFLPWVVGPAAVAALLVWWAKSRLEALSFLGAEAAAVASTIWLWVWLIFIKPDAQNGVAMMLFPAVQFAVLLVIALVVIAGADLVINRNKQERSRIALLTFLTIACAFTIVLLAWTFGYIQA